MKTKLALVLCISIGISLLQGCGSLGAMAGSGGLAGMAAQIGIGTAVKAGNAYSAHERMAREVATQCAQMSASQRARIPACN